MKRASWLLAIVAAGCAAGGAGKPAPEWVLVKSAAEGEFNTPIYAWQELRRFPTAEECATYHADLLEQAVSAGSREKLEAVYRQHCLPAAKMQPPAPR